MNCHEVMEYMQRQLDNDLSEAEQTLLESHLRSCASCRTAMERLQRLADELSNLPEVHPPVSLVDAILPKLAEIDRERQAASVVPLQQGTERGQDRKMSNVRRSRRKTYGVIGGVAAASLLLGIVISNFNGASQQLADNSLTTDVMSYNRETASDMATLMQDTAYDDGEPILRAVEEKHSSTTGEVEPSAPGAAPDASGEAVPRQPAGGDGLDVQPALDAEQRGAAEEPAAPPESHDEMGFGFDIIDVIDQHGNVAGGLASPDGSYSAYIENGTIVVLDADQERIYVSQSYADGEIMDLEWASNERLTFKIQSGQTVETYYIDVSSREEGKAS